MQGRGNKEDVASIESSAYSLVHVARFRVPIDTTLLNDSPVILNEIIDVFVTFIICDSNRSFAARVINKYDQQARNHDILLFVDWQ